MKWFEKLDKWVDEDIMGRSVEITPRGLGFWTLAVFEYGWTDGAEVTKKRYFDGHSPKEAVQKFLDSLQ